VDRLADRRIIAEDRRQLRGQLLERNRRREQGVERCVIEERQCRP
jgi:hypothetical protein